MERSPSWFWLRARRKATLGGGGCWECAGQAFHWLASTPLVLPLTATLNPWSWLVQQWRIPCKPGPHGRGNRARFPRSPRSPPEPAPKSIFRISEGELGAGRGHPVSSLQSTDPPACPRLAADAVPVLSFAQYRIHPTTTSLPSLLPAQAPFSAVLLAERRVPQLPNGEVLVGAWVGLQLCSTSRAQDARPSERTKQRTNERAACAASRPRSANKRPPASCAQCSPFLDERAAPRPPLPPSSATTTDRLSNRPPRLLGSIRCPTVSTSNFAPGTTTRRRPTPTSTDQTRGVAPCPSSAAPHSPRRAQKHKRPASIAPASQSGEQGPSLDAITPAPRPLCCRIAASPNVQAAAVAWTCHLPRL